MTEDHLLDRLDERYKNIVKLLEDLHAKADNGGWNRCVERGQKIISIEEKLKKQPSAWSMKVSAFLGGFVVVLLFVVSVYAGIIKL
jgi:hypothetical protein